MKTKPTEKQLKPVVMLWLELQGLIVPRAEIVLASYCDVMGYNFEPQIGREIPNLCRVVSVELKIWDHRGVICQCRQNRPWSTEVWAAMPKDHISRMRLKTLEMFRAEGIGLLAVDSYCDIVIPSPIVMGMSVQGIRRKLWRRQSQQDQETTR